MILPPTHEISGIDIGVEEKAHKQSRKATSPRLLQRIYESAVEAADSVDTASSEGWVNTCKAAFGCDLRSGLDIWCACRVRMPVSLE